MSALAFVFAVGISAWWITKDEEEKTDFVSPEHHGKYFWLVHILGWSSAALFVSFDMFHPSVVCFISVTAGCTSASNTSVSFP